jgi:hypothetical protein
MLNRTTFSGSRTTTSKISNEQESTMANKCDLKEEGVASSVAIQKDKKEPGTVSPRSLSPTAPQSFPCTLMEMINWCGESEQADEDGVSSLLCWAPNGEYFTINDQEKLSKHVLKIFFKDSKFDSFLRKLYRWGFKRVPFKSDYSGGRQGNLSFFVDGFERGDSYSCTRLKVHYSQKEEEARRQKSLKAKLKKMQKKSNEGHDIGWRKGNREQECATPDNRVISDMDYMAAPRGTCMPMAHDVQLVGPGRDTSGFSADNVSANNDYTQVALLAGTLALRQAEQLGCLLPLRQPRFPQQTTRNLYSDGTSSSAASCQLRILHDQIFLLKHRAVAKLLMKLRTIEEDKVALQGAACQLRELERRTVLSPQMCSGIARASLGRPYYPIGSAHPALAVMSLPQVYANVSASATSTSRQI